MKFKTEAEAEKELSKLTAKFSYLAGKAGKWTADGKSELLASGIEFNQDGTFSPFTETSN